MVLYFSGTGNSRFVARAIAIETGDELVCLNDRIKRGDIRPLQSDRPFVFVAPTYAWRIPQIVYDAILHTEFEGSSRAYFVMTCGDGVGNATQYLARLCEQKQFEFAGLAKVIMPENYIVLYTAPNRAEETRILHKALPKIKEIANKIRMRELLNEKPASFIGKLQSGLFSPVFIAWVSARGFRSTSACIGCGKCKELCPLNNIQIADGLPKWGGRCTHCMACICGCPTQAIEYGNVTKGKRRYYLTDEPDI